MKNINFLKENNVNIDKSLELFGDIEIPTCVLFLNPICSNTLLILNPFYILLYKNIIFYYLNFGNKINVFYYKNKSFNV